ncbi:MAG: two-component regulator propeller domain-containing protein [Bacteroidota bacterium]
MKTLLLCAALLCLFKLSAQQTCINYTDSRNMREAVIVDEHIYIATYGGLLKYNKLTEEKTFFNRGNSDIPSNKLTSIAKDSSNHLWIGTQSRLSYFDGTNWTWYDTDNSGLNDNYIYSVFVDRNNELWTGTSHILHFDGSNWTEYSSAQTGQNTAMINDIAQDSAGNMWFATNLGVLQFDGTAWTSHTNFGGNVNALVFDRNGTLWVGSDIGLYKRNGNGTWWPYNQNNTGMLLNNTILELAVDTNNILHIGTDNGLNKMKDGFWYRYSTFFGGLYPANHIECIVADNDGFTWVMPTDYIIKNKGLGYLNYTVTNSDLIYNQTTCIAADPATGDILYGTTGYGAGRKSGDVWTGYTVNNFSLPNNSIKDVSIGPDGSYWYATENGVAHFDGSNWIFYHAVNGLANNTTFQIHCNSVNGKVYVSTYSGLSEFDGTNWTTLTPNVVYGMANDAAGNMYFGTFGQFSKFDGTNWTVYNTGNSGFPNDGAKDMQFDSQGNLWITMLNSGLVKFNGTSCTVYNTGNSNLSHNSLGRLAIDTNDRLFFVVNSLSQGIRMFNGLTFTDLSPGIASMTVTDVTVDRDNIVWYATQGGISKYDPPLILPGQGTSNSGLWNNFVYDIDIDTNHTKTWFATRDGITSFDGENWEAFTYDETNIISNWIETVKVDHNGTVYAGSFYGLSVLNGSSFTNFSSIEYIKDIQVDASNVKWIISYGMGLIKFTTSVQASYTQQNSGNPDNLLTCLEIDPNSGDLWIGTNMEGVAVFDGVSSWTYYPDLFLGNYPYYTVYDIATDANGVKWIGTQHGLARFDGTTWTGYSMWNTPGFLSDVVTDVEIGANGLIYVGTTGGLMTFDGTTWGHYTLENSHLIHNYCIDMELDPYGNLWYSGSNDLHGDAGVSIFNPNGLALPPDPDFTASSTHIVVGESIDFTDLTGNNPAQWNWTFTGAGTGSSTMQNPTGISYNNPGCYAVELVVSNSTGMDSITKNCYITVVDSIPEADFMADQISIYTGNSVHFTDLSTHSPTSRSWTFTGGSPASSGQLAPAVTYLAAGCYDVSLTVTNSGGSDTETKLCYITVVDSIPDADFMTDQLTVFVNDPVLFTDLSTNNPVNRSWSFSGGNPSGSSLATQSVSYDTPGCYDVSLTVSNSSGSDTETKICYITVNEDINSLGENQQAVFTISPNPFNDQLLLEGLAGVENLQFTLYNNLGEVILSTRLEQQQTQLISTAEFAPGIYMYRISDGKTTFQNGKLIRIN